MLILGDDVIVIHCKSRKIIKCILPIGTNDKDLNTYHVHLTDITAHTSNISTFLCCELL